MDGKGGAESWRVGGGRKKKKKEKQVSTVCSVHNAVHIAHAVSQDHSWLNFDCVRTAICKCVKMGFTFYLFLTELFQVYLSLRPRCCV